MPDDGQSVVRLPRGQATLVAVVTVEGLGALVTKEPKRDDGARVWARRWCKDLGAPVRSRDWAQQQREGLDARGLTPSFIMHLRR